MTIFLVGTVDILNEHLNRVDSFCYIKFRNEIPFWTRKMVVPGAHTRQTRLASSGVPRKSAITDHVTNLDHLPSWNDINIPQTYEKRMNHQKTDA